MGKQSQTQKEKLWTGSYLLLIAMGTMTSTCFYMVNPTITKYAVGLGASVAAAGVISGLFSITALVARPFSGLVADRVNRKRLLIFSTCVMGLAALGYSVSRTVPLLIAFRILHGVAFAFSGTVNVTMIASLVPRSRLGEGVGYYGLVNIFATAIGPSLGLSLGDAFGFGLSYTTFAYSDISLSQSSMDMQGMITASVDVSNTGLLPGGEVVQLYIRDLVGSTTRPVKELKGFERIYLQPGQTRTVTFKIAPEMLKFYNYDLQYVIEPGDFQVMIGSNSRDVKTAAFTVTSK